jgi:hypothetical protein
VSSIGGAVWLGGAIQIKVEVKKWLRQSVAQEGIAREIDTGKEKEVVEDGRSRFEIIISSGYAQIDGQESGHLLGLKEGSLRRLW